MRKLVTTLAFMVAMLTGAGVAHAQQTAVTIEDAAWLAGRWVGEGFGGQMEEAWAPPLGGQMVGHFRYWRDGQPQFYEFMLIDVVENGLRLRVKHFNPDMVGWEERGEWHSFEPVSVTPNTLTFNGLVIQREGENRIVMTIRIRRGDVVSDDILTFERAPL